MENVHHFLETLLEDHAIDDEDVARIKQFIARDGQLDLDDVHLLVEAYVRARSYTPAFEELFFRVVKESVLADGAILAAEQFYLLKMLYSDRVVRDREKQFLKELLDEATEVTPEFKQMCDEAFKQ